MHVLGNMLFLWVFGDNVEDILGHWQIPDVLPALRDRRGDRAVADGPGVARPMVGARGAIAGVMGAYLVKFPRSRVVMLTWFLFIFTFDLPAWVMLIYWFAMQLFGGFGSVAGCDAGRHGVLCARGRIHRGDRADLRNGDAPALLAQAGPLLVMKPRVTLYTRAGCCLCDDAKRVLMEARRRADFDYEEVDIDTDPELRRLYNDEVPVIAINARKAFKYRVEMKEFLKKLAARA